MSFAIILSSLIIVCRRCPLLVAELIIRIIDQAYRLFLDNGIEDDITYLVFNTGYKNVSLPHHHCYQRDDLEFYTTTFRIGTGSFSGWRMRSKNVPDIYVECNFGDIKAQGTLFWRNQLIERINQEIAFLQLAVRSMRIETVVL